MKKRIKYFLEHRKAVLKVEKQCRGYNTFLCRLHDVDKIVLTLLFLPREWVSKIHRIYSWHHPQNKIGWFSIEEAIFDWESSRYTKPDKPLSAREFCLKHRPHLKHLVIPKCDKWGI